MLGIIVINPNLDAVAEAKITSQNYDAEFGQATAGVVSVQTRSGSNELHGSVFEFYRSDRFQARNPFTQPKDQPLPTNRTAPVRRLFRRANPERQTLRVLGLPGAPESRRGVEAAHGPHRARANGRPERYGVTIFDPRGGRSRRPPAFRRERSSLSRACLPRRSASWL